MSINEPTDESTDNVVAFQKAPEKNEGGGSVPPRTGEGMPPTRGGPQAPPVSQSLIEDSMPNFQQPREKAQWFAGKVSRQEVIGEVKHLRGLTAGDLRRMQQGLGMLTAMSDAMDSKVETLIRLLSETNVIDPIKYHEYTQLQLKFKKMLDGVNFVPNIPMKDKIATVIAWNEEFTTLPVHGTYVMGLADHLKANPDNLTPEELVHICEVMFIDPVESLAPGVVEAVVKQGTPDGQ